MHVSVAREIHATLIPNLQLLRDSLHAKAEEFSGIVKIGRTHLQVAVAYFCKDKCKSWQIILTVSRTASTPILYSFSMRKNIIHKGIPKGIDYSYHRQVSIAHHSSTYLYDNVAIYVQCREKLASS